MKTFIIAEVGSAWRFGYDDVGNAKTAIEIAKDCGADAVKFQWVSDPRLMEQRRNAPIGSYNILHWPVGWLKEFYEHATAYGIEFMCTVFLERDVQTLNRYVKRWKVASLENQDRELFLVMEGTGKRIIASHGGTGQTKWSSRMGDSFLHCTAAYPASLDSLNLLAIEIGVYDGYSDHSCDMLTGALAVACGAEIIEVHFRLNATPEDNPDYKHSHPPADLQTYIANIRKAELMLGDGVKRIEKCEEWALKHKVKA